MAAAAGDAHPYPIYNARYRVAFPIFDADGDLVTGAAALDSEVSQNQGTFADATNEATEVATSSGMYYLDLIATELDCKSAIVIVKTSTSGAKTTPMVLYPKRLPVIRTGTAQAGAASTITLDSGASAVDSFYNGCYVNCTNDTPSNVLGQCRKIISYVGSTKVATVEAAWGTNPSSSTTFEVLLSEEACSTTAIAGTQMVDPTTAGRQNVNTTHAAGTAWASGAITAASIASDAITDAKVASDVTIASVTGAVGSVTGAVGSVTGNVGGNVTGSVGSVAANGIAATSIATGAITAAKFAASAIDAAALAADAVTEIQSGLATAAALATVDTVVDSILVDTAEIGAAGAGLTVLATAANLATVAGYLDTEIAAVLADTNELQTDWVNGGRLDLLIDAIKAKTDALPAAPAATGDIPSAASIADAVWDEALSGHAGAGSAGEALSAAGTAGDPWTTSLPGAYGAGTAGNIIGNNLNATVSSRASQASLDTVDGIVDSILVDTAEIGAAGAGLTNINLPNQTMDIVGNITGSLSGSVGSVTGAVGSVTGAVGSVIGLTAADVAAIKAKTDSLTFTVAGQVDANIQSVNDVAINGTGVLGDEFAP